MKLESSGLEEALKEREQRMMSAMQEAGKALPIEDSDMPEFRLALKKKRAGALIMQALRDAGLEDISKMARLQRVTEE